MRRLPWGTALALALLSAVPVQAEEPNATCSILAIGLSSWQSRQCNVEDNDGTLTLSWLAIRKQTYRVDIVLSGDGRSAEAAWNGIEAKDKTDIPLGRLERSGDCWTGDAVTLCFERPGHGSEYDEDDGVASDEAVDDDQTEQGDYLASDPASSRSSHAEYVSTFRGLHLGMSEAEIAAALPAEFTLSRQASRSSGDKGIDEMNLVMAFFAAQAPNGMHFGSQFILDAAGRLCGEMSFANGRSDKMRLGPCYFGITTAITLEDFAQQIIDNYGLEDGMSYSWKTVGNGRDRFNYYEYVGVRRATSERFTAAVNDLTKATTLTIEHIPSVKFN